MSPFCSSGKVRTLPEDVVAGGWSGPNRHELFRWIYNSRAKRLRAQTERCLANPRLTVLELEMDDLSYLSR